MLLSHAKIKYELIKIEGTDAEELIENGHTMYDMSVW